MPSRQLAGPLRARTHDHHINGRPDDHDHGGTVINYHLDFLDGGAPHHPVRLVVTNGVSKLDLAGHYRRFVLERVRAVIDAELRDVPGGQLPAGLGMPSDDELDPAAVLAAVCRWISGDAGQANYELIDRAARHRSD